MEKWNKLCYYLSEKIKTNILESEFELIVEKGLEILGWDEYSGDFDIRPKYQLGSTKNSLKPDFVIKSNESGEKLFVVEIKRPKISLNKQNQTQLSTYMRQFKLDFGILIGPQIQIFYDGKLNKKENAILIENIEFKRESEKGKTFVELFSKENFDKNILSEFAKKSFHKINKKETEKEIKTKVLSQDFKETVTELIVGNLSQEYDKDLVLNVITNLKLEISEKFKVENITTEPKKYYSQETDFNDKFIIKLNPENPIEFKNRLLETKRAIMKTFYKDGTTKEKPWNANNFKASSSVIGNLRSRPDFRKAERINQGIVKVEVTIVE